MTSEVSNITKVSIFSQKILDEVASLSKQKLYKIQKVVDDEDLTKSWEIFGKHISRTMRQGRAIQIPKFGLFTFTSPSINVEGITSQEIRDKQHRQPIFLVSKEFIKGGNLSPAIFVPQQGLRSYSMNSVNGSIQTVVINWADMSTGNEMEKETLKYGVERVLGRLASEIRAKENVYMEIPGVGDIISKNKLLAVRFRDYLRDDLKTVLSQNSIEKRNSRSISLTSENLKKLQKITKENDDDTIRLDSKAVEWLSSNLNIDLEKSASMRSTIGGKSFISKRSSMSQSLRSTANKEMFDSITRMKNEKAEDTLTNKIVDTSGRKKVLVPLRIIALRKMRYYLRKKNLCPEDGYVELINCVKSKNGNSLDREQFNIALLQQGYELSILEREAFFRVMDTNLDNLIDVNDWVRVIPDEEDFLQDVRNTIKENKLLGDDLLRRMEIKDTSEHLSFEDVKKAFLRLDPYLGEEKCTRIAKSFFLLEEKYIDAERLIEALEIDRRELVDNNWLNSIFRKIYEFNLNRPLNEMLHNFEKFDISNQGILDVANFKTVLLRSHIDISVQDINRIVRFLDQDKFMMIDYINFLKRVKDSSSLLNGKSHIQHLADKIKEFLKINKFTPQKFMRHIGETKEFQKFFSNKEDPSRIRVEPFAKLIQTMILPSMDLKNLVSVCETVDIDQDGYIDKYDLETFLRRHSYLEDKLDGNKSFIRSSTPPKRSSEVKDLERSNQNTDRITAQSHEKISNLSSSQNRNSPSFTSHNFFSSKKKLFPVSPLSEEKLDLVLSDLRRALNERKMNFYDAFKLLDRNQDGFVTIDEFLDGLDKFSNISISIKEGLFAYMDHSKIGLIDFPRFLTVIKKAIKEKLEDPIEDSWDWQLKILINLKEWVKNRDLNVEEAFKLIDMDFDGMISEKDLRGFLEDILKVPSEQITMPRMNRLFKLMDRYKRGCVQILDFKALFDDGEVRLKLGDSAKSGSSTIKSIQAGMPYDWKKNAKQQIGLKLSKMYANLAESFDIISGHSDKLVYQTFDRWLEEKRILEDFNLTNVLIQQLFSDIDPHKKGFLTKNDWISAFGKFNWNEQIIGEITDILISNFKDLNAAYLFFLHGERNSQKRYSFLGSLSYSHFKNGINSMLPEKYNETEVRKIWNRCSGQDGTSGNLDYNQFKLLFGNPNFQEKPLSLNSSQSMSSKRLSKSLDVIKEMRERSPDLPSLKPSRGGISSVSDAGIQLFEKVKNSLNALHKTNLEEYFLNIDKQKTGFLSTLEFRSALRNLNIGLSSREIDTILTFCNNSNGSISWKEFCNKMKPSFSEAILLRRSRQKLEKIKENLYYFMLSPKDAFRQFNIDRSGLLSFDEFTLMINTLCKLNHEAPFAYSILRDLFDFIDIRKDGVLDLHEWMQTFRKLEENSVVPKGSDHLKDNINSLASDKEELNSKINKVSWESSNLYDKMVNFVGKNKTLFMEKFKEEEKKIGTEQISLERAKEIFCEVFNRAGVKYNDENVGQFLTFAQRAGFVDYRFLLENFRSRHRALVSHPM